jgi:hypothetical protein
MLQLVGLGWAEGQLQLAQWLLDLSSIANVAGQCVATSLGCARQLGGTARPDAIPCGFGGLIQNSCSYAVSHAATQA